MRIVSIVMMLIGAVLVTGCHRSSTRPEAEKDARNMSSNDVTLEDVHEKTAEAADAVMALADQTKDDYVSQVRSEMNQVEKRLETLRIQAKALGAQGRETWNKRIAKLAAKQQALQENLGGVADSSGDAWRELARGMTEAREEMVQALQKAEAEFNEQP